MRDVPPVIVLEGENVTCINQELEELSQKIKKVETKNAFTEERVKFLLETQHDFDQLESYVELLHQVIRHQQEVISKHIVLIEKFKKQLDIQGHFNAKVAETFLQQEKLNEIIKKRLPEHGAPKTKKRRNK